MNQKEFFISKLPSTSEQMKLKFIQRGWAPISANAVAWQLKKARKIKLNDKGLWVKR